MSVEGTQRILSFTERSLLDFASFADVHESGYEYLEVNKNGLPEVHFEMERSPIISMISFCAKTIGYLPKNQQLVNVAKAINLFFESQIRFQLKTYRMSQLENLKATLEKLKAQFTQIPDAEKQFSAYLKEVNKCVDNIKTKRVLRICYANVISPLLLKNAKLKEKVSKYLDVINRVANTLAIVPTPPKDPQYQHDYRVVPSQRVLGFDDLTSLEPMKVLYS